MYKNMILWTRLAIISVTILSANISFADPSSLSTPLVQQNVPDKAILARQVENSFEQWINAINSRSVIDITNLYDKDAILLPTMLNKVCNSPELIKSYFEELVKKNDLKVVAKEAHIRVFDNIAVNSGLYIFSFKKDQTSNLTVIPARFSFVYKKTPQGWQIIDHHSSKIP